MMGAKLKRHDGVVVEVKILQPIKLRLVTFHVQQMVVRQIEHFERWDWLTVKIERHKAVVRDVQSLQALHFHKGVVHYLLQLVVGEIHLN